VAGKKPKNDQLTALDPAQDLPQIGFDLDKQDFFIKSQGIRFEHHKGILSPIGKKERGDYRRADSLDTTSSNGMLYKCAGQFTAVLSANNKKKTPIDGGSMDSSRAYITLPRFYDADGEYANGDRIYLAPGDRIFVCNPSVDMKVAGEQEVHWDPNRDTQLMYPAKKVEYVIDSRGIEYFQGKDFKISKDGNLKWLQRNNPGVDPDTGKGRLMAVRYLYDAHWYITELVHEVRMGNVTQNGQRVEARLPYNAVVVREFIFHSRNNGDETKPIEKHLSTERESQEVQEPDEKLDSSQPFVRVQMSDIED
jgi:hypothetical protein